MRRVSHLKPIYAVWEDNAEAMASDIGELGVTVRQWRTGTLDGQSYSYFGTG